MENSEQLDASTYEKYQCDGKPGCTNAPDHVHPGRHGAKDKYYCSECCPPKDCSEAIGKKQL